jgi:quercetin dioxygenase-like cupin family protein
MQAKEEIMKALITTAVSVALLIVNPVVAQNIQHSPSGDRKTAIAPKENFTGHAAVTTLFSPSKFSNAGGANVEFAPRARSAWHTHPAGQTLVITSGIGWVQEDGATKREVRPGDVVFIPPNVRHWHGATDSTSMTHVAITPTDGTSFATWLEHVSDAQYVAN